MHLLACVIQFAQGSAYVRRLGSRHVIASVVRARATAYSVALHLSLLPFRPLGLQPHLPSFTSTTSEQVLRYVALQPNFHHIRLSSVPAFSLPGKLGFFLVLPSSLFFFFFALFIPSDAPNSLAPLTLQKACSDFSSLSVDQFQNVSRGRSHRLLR